MIFSRVFRFIAAFNRNRGFTPPSGDPKWQGAKYGGADKFLKYLSDELAPWVDANFRTVPLLQTDPPPALRMEHRYYPGEDHMSTPHRALYDGLELHFNGWRMPRRADEEGPTLAEVEAHYASLSQRFGFKVGPTPALDSAAKALLEKGETAAALAVLRRNVSEHSYLAATHANLGDALEKLGRKQEAALAYEQALRMQLASVRAGGDAIADYQEKAKELASKP